MLSSEVDEYYPALDLEPGVYDVGEISVIYLLTQNVLGD